MCFMKFNNDCYQVDSCGMCTYMCTIPIYIYMYNYYDVCTISDSSVLSYSNIIFVRPRWSVIKKRSRNA